MGALEDIAVWKISLSCDALGDRARAVEGAKEALVVYEQVESPAAEKVRQKLAEWQKVI